MPENNAFHPQKYSPEEPTAAYELLVPKAPAAFDSTQVRTEMASLGEALLNANVEQVYLVHGTLAGTDGLGVFGNVERFFPRIADGIGGQYKRLVDALVGDVGNFTSAFARSFEKSICQPLECQPSECQPWGEQTVATGANIRVERFLWSSENHHLGRAWAALRLLDQLLQQSPTQRTMIWGHSHAGNVSAIVTNFLGGADGVRTDFFEALEPDANSDLDLFRRMRSQFEFSGPSGRLAQLAASLDIVNFGTPIRYGWEVRGFRRLLHFVNHHPKESVSPWMAHFPEALDEIGTALQGKTGDYVQQTFIAGTDLRPSRLNRRAFSANRKLRQLFEPRYRRRDLIRRLKTGPRVAADGTTVLVDYAAADDVRARQLAGHGVYTTLAWLPFHLQQVVTRFYEQPA